MRPWPALCHGRGSSQSLDILPPQSLSTQSYTDPTALALDQYRTLQDGVHQQNAGTTCRCMPSPKMVCPRMVSMDVDDFRLIGIFGEAVILEP